MLVCRSSEWSDQVSRYRLREGKEQRGMNEVLWVSCSRLFLGYIVCVHAPHSLHTRSPYSFYSLFLLCLFYASPLTHSAFRIFFLVHAQCSLCTLLFIHGCTITGIVYAQDGQICVYTDAFIISLYVCSFWWSRPSVWTQETKNWYAWITCHGKENK